MFQCLSSSNQSELLTIYELFVDGDNSPLLFDLDKNTSANLDMGKSSFPEGDMDPARALERISRTTNDIFFGNVRQLNKNLTIFLEIWSQNTTIKLFSRKKAKT